MGHHHTETALLGSGWSLCKLLELYVGTLYPLVDMQSQGFKMNLSKDFFKRPSMHSLNRTAAELSAEKCGENAVSKQ